VFIELNAHQLLSLKNYPNDAAPIIAQILDTVQGPAWLEKERLDRLMKAVKEILNKISLEIVAEQATMNNNGHALLSGVERSVDASVPPSPIKKRPSDEAKKQPSEKKQKTNEKGKILLVKMNGKFSSYDYYEYSLDEAFVDVIVEEVIKAVKKDKNNAAVSLDNGLQPPSISFQDPNSPFKSNDCAEDEKKGEKDGQGGDNE
jgi:DNA-directed RNA polymerase beta' subunit